MKVNQQQQPLYEVIRGKGRKIATRTLICISGNKAIIGVYVLFPLPLHPSFAFEQYLHWSVFFTLWSDHIFIFEVSEFSVAQTFVTVVFHQLLHLEMELLIGVSENSMVPNTVFHVPIV